MNHTDSSTAAVATLCIEGFRDCIRYLEGIHRDHLRTKLADLRLWVDSVGAAAQGRASLDSRLQHRPSDRRFIIELLLMLYGFLRECISAATTKAGVQDILTNIDSTVDSLAFIGLQIRRSGRKSRLLKADSSFIENKHHYLDLRAHLTCVVVSKPTITGRPDDEGKDIHSFSYFTNLELSPIQERLVEANLRRRHRFVEAQRHSLGLKAPSGNNSHPAVATASSETESTTEGNIATAIRRKQAHRVNAGDNVLTIPATSASGLDSEWRGLPHDRQGTSTATRITGITAASMYPKARRSQNPDQKMVKCPCCCQAIPTSELQDSQWRKHVANDLCPYTCVLENCPTPYSLFVTRKEWSDHVINDHPPCWQCPCCEGDPPIFSSVSEITTHFVSDHDFVGSDELEELLSKAEVSIMGITQCPLCDSAGPRDSPDLVEHVLEHVHDFSLRSLPWPDRQPVTLTRSAGSFDFSRAINLIEDDEGNTHVFNIAEWAEGVAPVFDRDRRIHIVNGPQGQELFLSTDESPSMSAMDSEVSLHLCDLDKNPPRLIEDELRLPVYPTQDYFSHNEYFVDDSSNGYFPTQNSYMSQKMRGHLKSRRRRSMRNWCCPLCLSQGTTGENGFYQHMEHDHPEAEETEEDRLEEWKRTMLHEALWNVTEVSSAASIPIDATGSQSHSRTSAADPDESKRDSYTENTANTADKQQGQTPDPLVHLEKSKLQEAPAFSNPVGGAQLPDNTELPKKKSINDFVILEEMGQGAYAEVKLARYKQDTSTKVILKYIKKSRILVDTWTRDRRLGTVPLEIHVLDYLRRPELKHPKIVEMIDFFEDEVNYYIEMVPHGIPGIDLFDYVELRANMHEQECRNIFLQAAEAVYHLHVVAQVVHRDIKDENFILDGEGNLQLIDFGSAAYVKTGPFDVFVGTIDYATPEVLHGKSYNGKEQDIWALGIVLYILLYKENPFYSVDEIMDRDLRVPFIISDESIDLVRCMLNRDHSQRYDIQQVLDHPWCKMHSEAESSA
ncbi:hypothetical protein JX265_001728 [Neoarthrinium moseri]|uniref:non-specific serine/threonine protein kinase n=1 Tax=Neoarthrinium moseri TaxID=1658444 RepID=A0A9P9WVJ8_9PEZI|nr:hypothetical protein JX265_001728 [Neoarthrinium moseri]